MKLLKTDEIALAIKILEESGEPVLRVLKDLEKAKLKAFQTQKRIQRNAEFKGKHKASSISALKGTLDRVFQLFIRLKHTDSYGNCRCYTCGKKLSWGHIEAGHYMPRKHLKTRWHEENLRPQCFICNHAYEGEHVKFKALLEQDLGKTPVQIIETAARAFFRPNRIYLESMITEYRSKVESYRDKKLFTFTKY